MWASKWAIFKYFSRINIFFYKHCKLSHIVIFSILCMYTWYNNHKKFNIWCLVKVISLRMDYNILSFVIIIVKHWLVILFFMLLFCIIYCYVKLFLGKLSKWVHPKTSKFYSWQKTHCSEFIPKCFFKRWHLFQHTQRREWDRGLKGLSRKWVGVKRHNISKYTAEDIVSGVRAGAKSERVTLCVKGKCVFFRGAHLPQHPVVRFASGHYCLSFYIYAYACRCFPNAHCRAFKVYIRLVFMFSENQTHDLCTANTMLGNIEKVKDIDLDLN